MCLEAEISRLSLRNNTMLHGSAMINMPAASTIEDLDLCMCRRIDADTMAYILAQFAHLRKLSLYRLFQRQTPFKATVPTSCSCYRLGGAILMTLPSSLHWLDISYCNELDTASVCEYLRSNGHRLFTLRIEHLRCNFSVFCIIQAVQMHQRRASGNDCSLLHAIERIQYE